MARLDPRSSQQFLHTLRQHVFEPVSAAETAVEREQAEIEAERAAYEEFAERVESVPTTTVPASSPSTGTFVDFDRSVDSAATLREAFHETVMAVSHYDEVYGESLAEHVAGELGPEFVVLFDSENSVAFTEQHRDAIVAAVERRHEERADFSETLESELDSLRRSRRELRSVLEGLDTTIVPSWYRSQLEDDLEAIVEDRQSILGSRTWSGDLDGHDFCGYLYADHVWTYPVLAAVGRLLNSLVLRE